MSKMNLLRNAIAASLAVTVFVTSSLVALASPDTHSMMGELTVSGTAVNGDTPFATINGERAFTGRTIQNSTTITTPASTNATINLGKLGRIELAPNSNLVLSFNENGISAELLSGKVRVSGADNAETSIQTKDSTVVADKSGAKAFAVNFDGSTRVSTEAGAVTLNGKTKTVKVNAGETKSTGAQDDDDDGDIVPGSVVLYAIIFGAAAAALIYVAATDNNEISVGSGTSVISPTR